VEQQQQSSFNEPFQQAAKSADGTAKSAAFPSKAPSAPPLPEEGSTGGRVVPSPAPSPFPPLQDSGEFLWLFEYGLEMESSFLNSMERLDGMALPYGPAHLKDYVLGFGYVDLGGGQTSATLATLLPATQNTAHSAGVWGMLFRVPRHVTERGTAEASLLDTIHGAAPPLHLYQSITVEVRETQRQQTVSCLTYLLAPATLQNFYPLTASQKEEDTLVRRLDTLARKLHLPVHPLSSTGISSPLPLPPYVSRAEQPVARLWPSPPAALVSDPTHHHSRRPTGRNTTDTEQVAQNPPQSPLSTAQTPQQRWLMVFSGYLALLLPITLTLIVLQSLGILNLFQVTNSPVGVPVLVLIYGLLGGCISSILTLRRAQTLLSPSFVLLTWFTRPYIGAVLALLTFLLLQSGIIAINGSIARHGVFFLLASTLAGLCEHWLFVRR
jgi:cation transport regulator ChaC